MGDDVEGSQFDIGTTSIRLVRVGNLIQVLSSSPFEARFLYKELVERYKREQHKLEGDCAWTDSQRGRRPNFDVLRN